MNSKPQKKNYDMETKLNEIHVIQHAWITMSDGVRLSAKIWLPKNSHKNTAPAILEIIPYRKRDAYSIRDHSNHAWLAERGYACIRPDMRGHGDSEGIMFDEYSTLEQEDTIEVIEWISKQPWCDGSVGMIGLSWGGIASLQAAAKKPSALKAIIPVGASLDRYYDDGGYLLGGYPGQGLGWGGVMFGYCIRPPDPAVVGDRWRDMWLERLENTPMFAEKWLSHQLRDASWKQGSVCEDFESIETPVLGVSGWNDCWPNTVIRLLENLNAPCKVVSGAWGHVFPNLGGPGPQIDFLDLTLQWFDFWLKGAENGVLDQPTFLAYLQESHKPDPNPTERPGRWVSEDVWPSPNIEYKSYGLFETKLLQNKKGKDKISICSPVSLGLNTGEYMPISGVEELPRDQISDDEFSLCFDSDILSEYLDLLGTPLIHLRLSSNYNCGLIAARLCDLAPDGSSTLISFGILNLKQRKGREILAEVVPNKEMDLTLRFNDTGWSLKPGHKLRLALSTNLWPMAWPVEKMVTLELNLKDCTLEIPTRKSMKGRERKVFLGEPTSAEPLDHTVLKKPMGSRKCHHNKEDKTVSLKVVSDTGQIKFNEIDLTYSSSNSQIYSIKENDHLSPKITYEAEFGFVRDTWKVQTKSKLVVTCSEESFFLKGSIFGYENDTQVFTRSWDIAIPRVIF